MKVFNYVAINTLFMAFFVYSGLLPVYVFNGIYTLIWVTTILAIVLISLGMLGMAFSDDTNVFEGLKDKMPKRSKWFYRMDFAYDVLMVFVLGATGHYIYIVFYVLANILVHVLRHLVYES